MSHDTTKAEPQRHERSMPRGQVLVIFAFLLTILIGMAAFVVDIAWIWSHQLQVQRAADAGALAGVVHLPQQPDDARTAAQDESQKNGYEDGEDGVVVDARQDPDFGRRMIVTVSAPVDTFFMRVFGFDQVTVSRTSRAEYILPVPMGSPQNYLGVGRLVDSVTTTTTTTSTVTGDTGFELTGDSVNGGQWANPDGADDEDNQYTTESTNNHAQQWDEFGLLGEIPDEPSLVITGLEVRLQDVRLIGSGASSSCRLRVATSWNGGGTWSTTINRPITWDSDQDTTVGSSSSTSPWGAHTWTRSEYSDSNFRVRLTWQRPNSNCATSRQVQLDALEVRVHYRYTQTTTTTTTTIEEVDVRDPYDTVDLEPQNFWAGMQSQGAPSVQGDAFMTKYTTRTSAQNPAWCPAFQFCASDPEGYYNYAVEIPSGGGEVWLFDPGFCDVGTNRGTAENWSTGGSYGPDDPNPVSSFFTLYNTQNTAWDFSDDSVVYASDNGFRRGINNNGGRYFDDSLRNEGGSWNGTFIDCDDLNWHNDWVQIANGLPAGTYRLHTSSYDAASPSDQNHTTALNAFAIWARASSGIDDVRVYGLGAMEAYFPLPAGEFSDFYLAQIEAVHAGKWMDISLWDPGDTGGLRADLSILMPTSTGWVPASFYYNTVSGTQLPDDFTCGPSTSSARTSLQTSAGSGGFYNGQWVRVCIQIPADYTAPKPPQHTINNEGGWWKIGYDMGSGSNPSTDLTTWKVDIRGNPVHLIIPEDDTPTP